MSTATRTRRTVDRQDLHRLADLVEQAAAGTTGDTAADAAVVALAEQMRSAIARANTITADAADTTARLDQLRADLVAQVAAGTLTPSDAARQIANAQHDTEAATTGAKAVAADAARLVRRQLLDQLRSVGDGLAVDLLGPAARATGERLHAAGQVLVDAQALDAAAVAGSAAKVHRSWSDLHDAHDQLRLLWRIAATLRDFGILSEIRNAPAVLHEWHDVTALDRSPDDVVPAGAVAPLRTWQAVARGGRPDVLTADQVTVEHLVEP